MSGSLSGTLATGPGTTGKTGAGKSLPPYSLGIDIGYSSVKIALTGNNEDIVYTDYVLHKGKTRETLKRVLEDLFKKYGPEDIATGAVTGSESRVFTTNGGLVHVNEVSALIEGTTRLNGSVRSIIEIGGETARYITLPGAGNTSAVDISTNSSCSAGTGSFLEEQVSRLDLNIEDYTSCAAKGMNIPRIAGRCSVFAKTDIIHHQQEGVPVEDILRGLAYALVRNYRTAVIRKRPLEKPVMLAGGVANNGAIVLALKDVLGLDGAGLIIPEKCGNVTATGAALIAKRDGMRLDPARIPNLLEGQKTCPVLNGQDTELPGLDSFGHGDGEDKHFCKSPETTTEKTDCWLGVDIGSTSTNFVLINEADEIIACRYLRTLGDPVKAVITGLEELGGELKDRVNIVGAGTTGSGRYMIARLIGADMVRDEITAQAKAAVTIDNSVDTVFEIGGQDSKYISLENGRVTDFQMNKICAAGTGSFIEEQSKKFDIPVEKFGNIALRGKKPVNLGERCTVFIGTSIAAHLAEGTVIEDIASGLCYSIVKNYLNRVVGNKKIGSRIFLQGGIAYNQGVVNAFRALTGREIIVPRFFSVTGAYGVAVLTREENDREKTGFRGFYPSGLPPAGEAGTEPAGNDGTNSGFDGMITDTIFEGYDGSVDETKKTIGIPRALFTYGMYPMFSAFFRELGYNVVLSNPTSEETIRLGQEYSLEETCYPVKLINGHVAELVNKKVDYIFFPDLYTVPHPGSHSRQDFGCPYMQLAFKVVNRAMELDKRGITLLSPTIGFSLGDEFMKNSFMALGRQLEKTPEETAVSLRKGMEAFHDFERRVEEKGRELVRDLKPDEKAFVLISKTYGIADPALNLGIPDRLKEMGYKTLAFFNLPQGDIAKEHPNMYWPFGQHILEAAQIVRHHPNLYAIFLTHHGCGPDTVFSHYFREIMAGKPYLTIEVDEHSSGVGVITRLEAFTNSISSIPAGTAEDMETYPGHIMHTDPHIKTSLAEIPGDARVFIPNLYPYSWICCEFLNKKGIKGEVLPETGSRSIDRGRKHTLTNEYFSMAALTGDFLEMLKNQDPGEERRVLLVPQTEGAEVDGQYNRYIRTVLDEKGIKNVDIAAPFIEDLIYQDEEYLERVFLTLIAGDIIMAAPHETRERFLTVVLEMIRDDRLDIRALKMISEAVSFEWSLNRPKKTVLAIGEPAILFNSFLNDKVLKNIECRNFRVVYAPLSEYMWIFWKDFIDQNGKENRDMLTARLAMLRCYISEIHRCLSGNSPFEDNLCNLSMIADNTVGYYAGAFGRYRESKTLGETTGIDGIVTVSSLYENTGILLNVLHNGFGEGKRIPILNLTFDGNKNENDATRVESFLQYL